MIERFFVGPDALIGPLDASFRRGVSPPAGGEFLSQRWERNQRIAGDAADGLRLRFAPPRSIGPLSPDPLWRTHTCQVLQWFRRAKPEWRSAVLPGPLGPGFPKIAAGAVSLLRLALPGERARCVYRRRDGPCGRLGLLVRILVESPGTLLPKYGGIDCGP